MTDEQRQIALELLADGWSVRQTAVKVGVSPMTISRLRRKAAALALPPPTVAPATLPTDPRARLEAIRDAWLTVAEDGLQKLRSEPGTAHPPLSIQTGIASQRATELVRLLDEGHGLPEELPDDDEEARRIVRRLCYRVARTGGQAAAWKMAAAVGLGSAQRQPVEIGFERPPLEEETDASSSAALPASSTRLQ